jgi:protein-S-isoprenylcysteine O-methyltransferase Ste14
MSMKTLRALAFTYRSYTPIPFLILMVLTARPTLASLVVGFGVLSVGELIRFWGVSIAGAETRTTGTVGGTYLITSGPFAYVRNPLYLGNMLMYTGIGIMSMALFPWLQIAALAWFAVQYHLIVAGEEEYLAGRFGAEYEEYRRRVPRFLPRLSPYVSSAAPAKTLDPAEGLASEKRTLQAIGIVTMILVVVYVVRQG